MTPTKSDLRTELLAKRKALGEEEQTHLSDLICARLLPLLPAKGALALYYPVWGEVNILGVTSTHASFCLPSVTKGTKLLSFHAWRQISELEKGSYGILQPSINSPTMLPDIVVVPLVAFDRKGMRIGYGKGYYDATLSHLRSQKPITAIGLAYGFQEVDNIPAEPFDQALDLIVTEHETIAIS